MMETILSSLDTESLTFLDVIYLELSSARINGTSEASTNNWLVAADSLKELIRCAYPHLMSYYRDL